MKTLFRYSKITRVEEWGSLNFVESKEEVLLCKGFKISKANSSWDPMEHKLVTTWNLFQEQMILIIRFTTNFQQAFILNLWRGTVF